MTSTVRTNQGGFTLPSVLLISIMLLALLVMALQLATSADNALRSQYYNQLAREATEAGLARAKDCLGRNNSLAQWTNSKKLKTDTDCYGNALSGASPWVLQSGIIRTSFEVNEPDRSMGVMQNVLITGKTEIIGAAGHTGKTYNYHQNVIVGANTTISEVAFGHNDKRSCADRWGAYFVIIDENNTVQGAGLNSCGQLGNGTLTDSTQLTKFQIPPSKTPSKVFTSFTGSGTNTFVLTTDGEVYGSGYNEDGEIGNGRNDFDVSWAGHLAETQPWLMRKDNFPADDKKIIHVIPNGYVTFVVTEKGAVYATGYSGNGGLGINWSETNGYKDIPVKVQIPAGEKPLISEGSWATKARDFDKYTNLMITESGKVYGWGDNFMGQLGYSSYGYLTKPSKIGQFGDAGQAKAKQVALDGKTSYVLDEQGDVWAAGHNLFGQAGSKESMIWNKASNLCLRAHGGRLSREVCNPGDNSQWWTFDGGLMKARANSDGSNKLCAASRRSGDWRYMDMTACNGADDYQKFGVRINTNRAADMATSNGYPDNGPFGYIRNTAWANAYCLYDDNGDIKVDLCTNVKKYLWQPHVPVWHKIDFPAGKKAVSISTDQYFASAVMTDGTVYSWGMHNGALGDGRVFNVSDLSGSSNAVINWRPVQFNLPAGVKGLASWSTSGGFDYKRANTFVIGDDCRVYGAGSNIYGQLGIGRFGGGDLHGVYFTPQQMNVVGAGTNGCAAHVRSGYGTTIIYTTNRKVFTVGNNSNGQLGEGTTNNSHTPTARNLVNISRKALFY